MDSMIAIDCRSIHINVDQRSGAVEFWRVCRHEGPEFDSGHGVLFNSPVVVVHS